MGKDDIHDRFVDGSDPALEDKFPWLRNVPPEWQCYHLMRARQWQHRCAVIARRAHAELELERAVKEHNERRRRALQRRWFTRAAFALFAALVIWAGRVI